MFNYPAYIAAPSEEPIIPHISQRFEPSEVELDSEVRYLGNMYNYCGYFNKALVDCVEGEVKKGNKKIFKECKTHLEQLHDCYSLKEPTELEFENRFVTENEECSYQRDTFLKCYFRQANDWDHCHSHWLNIYRCRFRKDPSKFNFN